ncbi:hypothetical protein SAMN05421539_10572 [Jannaschia seohaensis]|uniref:TadE-like protein n=2 Tax=Jannaschia seohaensis TaxID=475081 RepID=A0A2Y9AQ98_9RHOB|nr:hypothetical protein BCF38_10572 [Jannaschia seohaensis]SSA46610.1 hypothetical protein SAMN05421539_10572 [Jannaschia seohaensis]
MMADVADDMLRFVRDESGGMETISVLLWMPLVLSLFMLVADLSYVLFSRSNLMRIAEDGTRLRSLGVFETDLEVVDYIGQKVAPSSTLPPTISSTVSLGVVRTQLQVNVSSIEMLGIISRLSNDVQLTIAVSQFKENPEV